MTTKTAKTTTTLLSSSSSLILLLLLGNRRPQDFACGFAPTSMVHVRKASSGSTLSRIPNPFHSPSRRQTRTTTTQGIKVTTSTTSLAAAPVPTPLTLTSEVLPDLLAVTFGGSLLLFYHIRLFLKERSGKQTWRRVQADTREAWAKHVRDTQGWLYAIQTLRNAITAQTFLATTVLSLLTVIGGRLWDIVRQMPANGRQHRLAIFQLILFVIPMISSAYYFLQSARLMTHAGFMFPVESETTNQVDLIMRKTEHAQWLGLRCLYLSGGILSLIVGGPMVFAGTSFLLTTFFRKVDRAPMSIMDDTAEEE